MKNILIIIILFIAISLFAQVQINEVYYDTPLTGDAGAFVELKGPPGKSLDGFSIYGINGSDGTVYNTIDLTGYTIPADSYFVIADSSIVSNYDLLDANVDYQNGPDNIVLDSAGTVIDAVGYGDFSAAVFAGYIFPAYDVFAVPLARMASVYNNYYDYMGFANTTPGYANPNYIVTDVFNVQNSLTASPLEDSTVAVSGVITAIFNYDNAYYIQSGPGAFQGVEIWDMKADSYAIGDSIAVIGYVYENWGKTVIEYGVSTLLASGLTPFDIEVLLADIGEPFEGQLLTIKRVYVANDSLGYGEWLVKDGVGDSLRIDDRSGNYTTPITGTKLYSITGVLDFSYGNYKLQPRDQSDIVVGYGLTGKIGLSDAPADSSGSIIEIVEMSYFDTTDASGNYMLDYIPSGTYTIIVSHTGYKSDTSIFTLSSDTTHSITLNKILTYRVYGTVGLSDAPADSSGTIVEIPSIGAIDTTDASGYYEIAGLANGTYTIYYSHTGYDSDSAIINIADNDVQNDIVLNATSGVEENNTMSLISSFEISNGSVSFVYNKTSSGISKIDIYDLTGRTIISKTFTNKGIYNVNIDNNLPVGLYFLSIQDSENNFVKKFIIIE